jgi:hypothetical protein
VVYFLAFFSLTQLSATFQFAPFLIFLLQPSAILLSTFRWPVRRCSSFVDLQPFSCLLSPLNLFLDLRWIYSWPTSTFPCLRQHLSTFQFARFATSTWFARTILFKKSDD